MRQISMIWVKQVMHLINGATGLLYCGDRVGFLKAQFTKTVLSVSAILQRLP